jgi:hypothetical protein
VRAKLEQRRLKCDALHVVILPAAEGVGGFGRLWGPHDDAATYWRLWNIVVAACPLADATVTLVPDREFGLSLPGEVWRAQGKTHFIGPLVDAARAGEPIPLLHPSEYALQCARQWIDTQRGPFVTLTIRRNSHDGRDSSRDWTPFRAWLEEKGFNTLVLDDTVDALKSPVGPFATVSVDLRAALYESAAMNCFVNNGPMVLAWHTRAPYLVFNAALPEKPWKAHWEKHQSLKTGDQLPWASGPRQRLVYRPDERDVMIEEFECVMAGS